jgi:ribosomal protein S18 acetylase RimI-like enzyme
VPDDHPRIAIREATAGDAPTIARIHVEGWQTAYRGLVPDAVLDGFSIEHRTDGWRASLTRPPSESRTWLVEGGGVVVGVAATGPGRDESAPPPPGSGEVWMIYLAAAARGRGIGRRLFDHAVADLQVRGFAPIVVWVFEANPVARRLYESAGFVVDGARNEIDFDGLRLPEIRYQKGTASSDEG